jgi:hypothetical protein
MFKIETVNIFLDNEIAIAVLGLFFLSYGNFLKWDRDEIW